MTGETIGRYKLLSKIGEGGMGEVYLAEDTTLDRKVALKLLSRTDEADVFAKRRFLREAKAAASIDHPYICKIYEAGEHQGRVYIAMEYIDGETLEARLAQQPASVSEACHILTEVAEALAKAHQSGLIHRDLKPSNIMVTTSGHVKVLDFGLAERVIRQTDETMPDVTAAALISGTLAYMSPEQICGRLLDQRSDIFSLGIVLYEMLTGMHPFKKPSPLETGLAILNEEPKSVRGYVTDCPPGIEAALAGMLAKTVTERFAHVDEVLEILRDGQSGANLAPLRAAAAPAFSAIAVLPFVNMSPDAEQEYFSDGITEDIIREVSRIPGVRVLARTSIMRYKNSQKEIAEIGAELGVGHIIEGSVRRIANRVRISAGLVDIQSKAQVWSEVYNRELTDVFFIQGDVASQIAKALSMTLSISQRASSDRRRWNIDAYQSYLKGMYLLNKLVPDSIEKSLRFFDDALKVDPAEARAYTGIAYANCMLGHFDYLPPRVAFARAKAAAMRAYELDIRLPETHICMGLTQMFNDWDWQAAKQSFRQALTLNASSADAHIYFSWCLCLTGDTEEAVTEARHAQDLDPLSPTAGTNLAQCLVYNGQFEEAIRVARITIDLDPHYASAYAVLGHAYLGNGQHAEGLAFLDKWSWRKTLRGLSYAFVNQPEQAETILEEVLRPDSTERPRPSEIGLLYFLLGKPEEAAPWFKRALEERDYMLAYHLCPKWLPFRNDPLLVAHLKQMGIEQ